MPLFHLGIPRMQIPAEEVAFQEVPDAIIAEKAACLQVAERFAQVVAGSGREPREIGHAAAGKARRGEGGDQFNSTLSDQKNSCIRSCG
jgi:hypothetical protein